MAKIVVDYTISIEVEVPESTISVARGFKGTNRGDFYNYVVSIFSDEYKNLPNSSEIQGVYNPCVINSETGDLELAQPTDEEVYWENC